MPTNKPDATDRDEHGISRSDAEMLYRTIFTQSPDGILDIDTAGSFIDFNESAHRLLGYTREEFSRLRLSEIDACRTSAEIEATMKTIIAQGSAEFECKLRRKDGDVRQFHVFTRAMSLSGRPAFHSIWRDITESKRAAEELKDSAEKYRDLFENANDAIFIVDADLRYLDVNKRASELFGYSREEFLTMSILDVIPPEQLPRSDDEFDKLRHHGTYEKFTGRMRTKDGRWLDIEVNSSAIVRDGKVVGSRDIVRDVTDRKRSEDALRESQNFLQTIIETEPECVKLLDRDGNLLMMNKAGLAMIDAESLDQVKGTSMYGSIAPEYRDAFKKNVDDVFLGKSGTLEFDMIGLKGRRLRLETHAVPLRNGNNEISALLGVTRNITERKKLEDELIRAQKLESVGILAGGIAHDFNNLLTAILGNISLAKLHLGGDNKALGRLAEAENASLRARDLTQQLLTFALAAPPSEGPPRSAP